MLMDWHMPGMERSRGEPRHQAQTIVSKHIPKIVMVTAFGREDIRAQAERIGVEGYLLKPVSASSTPRHINGSVRSSPVSTKTVIPRRETMRVCTSRGGSRILLVEDNESEPTGCD